MDQACEVSLATVDEILERASIDAGSCLKGVPRERRWRTLLLYAKRHVRDVNCAECFDRITDADACIKAGGLHSLGLHSLDAQQQQSILDRLNTDKEMIKVAEQVRELARTSKIRVAPEKNEAQYQVVADRRLGTDSMMWQVPVLSLTAQAFLFTIALSGDTPMLARKLAALLAGSAAAASLQLMSKHRQHEFIYSKWLEAFENEYNWEAAHGRPVIEVSGLSGWFVRRRSYNVWWYMLALFFVVAVFIFFCPHYFEKPIGR